MLGRLILIFFISQSIPISGVRYSDEAADWWKSFA